MTEYKYYVQGSEMFVVASCYMLLLWFMQHLIRSGDSPLPRKLLSGAAEVRLYAAHFMLFKTGKNYANNISARNCFNTSSTRRVIFK